MINKQTIITVVVLIVIVGAIFLLESRKVKAPSSLSTSESDIEIKVGDTSDKDRAKRIEEKSSQYELAKEISTPDGFINTDEVKIADLIGKKIILVDFWTYSCINCQRTLPYLNSWYEEYGDKGLVILGVHTPEFGFEEDYDNVKKATEKFDIKYPVILDNDYSTWTAYKNRYWPRKYLIDIDGFIVYDHIGEGSYDETEEKIVELLNERSKVLGETAVALNNSSIGADTVDFSKVLSPETYLGYKRGQYLANFPSQDCLDKPCDFVKPDDIQLNTYVLSGRWNIKEEEASLVDGPGEIVIRFSAGKVNLVAGSMEDGVKAEILLDGKLVDSSNRGSDVSNNGTATFEEHTLYNLIDLQGNYGEHQLIIRFLEPGVQAFAFTFG